MGLLDFFNTKNINDHMEEFLHTPGAVLVDVRTTEEYHDNRIDNSVNIPLSDIEETETIISDKNTPVFVYCRSGNRSGQAASILHQMGYTDVRNIGGIIDYKGITLNG